MSSPKVPALRLPGIGSRYVPPADGQRQVVVEVEVAGPAHPVDAARIGTGSPLFVSRGRLSDPQDNSPRTSPQE
jgi:hypothetical protein